MAKTSDENGRIPPSATAGFNTRDGVAVRRPDKWMNTDAPAIGWLNGSPVAKSSPQGGADIPYGPSSPLWNRKGGKAK
jgi:hypothetical protein